MPRHRASNKKALGIYLTDQEHDALRRMAESRGCFVTDIIRDFIHAKMREEEAASATTPKTTPRTKHPAT